MSADLDLAVADELIRHGVPDGTTLRDAMEILERLVVAATLEREPKIARAARRLGVTREGLYGIRRRLGIEVRPALKEVPADWREKLTG